MMLMMKDLQVHFHIFPRYEKQRIFAGIEWVDTGWINGMPEDVNFEVSQDIIEEMRVGIKEKITTLTK
jgi:diadenosine tetraphosphate (Ap4A) HIT family hydrolase